MSPVFIFEVKDTKNFQLLKGCFFIMDGPMDMIFGVFSETYVKLNGP